MRMYSSQPCSAVCGVAEYAPVFYHVQQEAFVEDAEVASKEEEGLRCGLAELAATGLPPASKNKGRQSGN